MVGQWCQKLTKPNNPEALKVPIKSIASPQKIFKPTVSEHLYNLYFIDNAIYVFVMRERERERERERDLRVFVQIIYKWGGPGCYSREEKNTYSYIYIYIYILNSYSLFRVE